MRITVFRAHTGAHGVWYEFVGSLSTADEGEGEITDDGRTGGWQPVSFSVRSSLKQCGKGIL